MARVHERLGSQVLPGDLDKISQVDNLQYDPYEDETWN